MTMRVRATLIMIAAVAMIMLSGCDHYNCGTGPVLGSSCAPSTPGLNGGGGGGTSAATAFAFVVDDQNDTIDGYTLSTSAATFAPTSPYTAPAMPANFGGVGLVVAQNKFLYGVFPDLPQQVYGWSIDSTGNLTTISGFPLSVPLTIPTLLIYNQYAVITNPAGTLLFISDAGIDQIIVYQIDSTTGALTQAPGSPFAATGITPQNMGMDGLGKYLYVSSEGNSLDHAGTVVGAFTVASNGALSPIAGSPFNYPLWEMQGDPTGQYLIGISGETVGFFGSDDDSVYVFNINKGTGGGVAGSITPVANSPFSSGIYAPFNLAVQPTATSGALIYTFSENDDITLGPNPVEGYQLSTSNGALTAATGSPFSALTPSAWGQFDPSGNYLFFYSGISTSVGLGAYQVTTGGTLTSIGSSVPLTTASAWTYWAIADAQ